jgi:hypothetical protein
MSRPISSTDTIPQLLADHSLVSQFPLLCGFLRIWTHSRPAFLQTRTHLLCLSLALGLISAFGRRTITRAICARAGQFVDWSATYRFLSKDRWFPLALQHIVLLHASAYTQPGSPLVVALDDSGCPKSGKRIPSAGYFYDPKSPPFARSFHWSLRFISMSVILAPYGLSGPARGIPIRFDLAPAIRKPKKKAPQHVQEEYRSLSRIWCLSTQGAEQIGLLRAEMDGERTLRGRLLVVVADSSYCNSAVMKNLPGRSVLVARTRKDIALYSPPGSTAPGSRGRRRIYGEALPTPEQVRQSDIYPWHTTTIFAAGNWHTLRYKSVSPVLWKSAGGRPLRLVVIAPLRYRPKRGSALLYRDPAYLLISDPSYSVTAALQHYFHRWEIEVNHRDEKDVFGIGDPQVWNPRSVARQPAFTAVLYSWLVLASLAAYGPGRGDQYLPHPKWRNNPPPRPSALDLVSQLRLELMSFESGLALTPFAAGSPMDATGSKRADQAERWLAETVPKGLSTAAFSSMLYACA